MYGYISVRTRVGKRGRMGQVQHTHTYRVEEDTL